MGLGASASTAGGPLSKARSAQKKKFALGLPNLGPRLGRQQRAASPSPVSRWRDAPAPPGPASNLASALLGGRRPWRRDAVRSRGAAPDDVAHAPCRWRQLGLCCVRQERCGHGQLLQRGRCLAWQLWGRSRAHVAGGLQRVQRCGGARSRSRPNGARAGTHGRRRPTRCQPELQCVWHKRCGRVELLQLWRRLARQVRQRSGAHVASRVRRLQRCAARRRA